MKRGDEGTFELFFWFTFGPHALKRGTMADEDSRKWRALGPVICSEMTLVRGRKRSGTQRLYAKVPRACGQLASWMVVFTALLKSSRSESSLSPQRQEVRSFARDSAFFHWVLCPGNLGAHVAPVAPALPGGAFCWGFRRKWNPGRLGAL